MSSKDPIKTTNEFYDLNERLLMLTGLWPYQEKFEKFFRTCIVNVSLLLALLFEFYRFYTYVFDMKSIVEEFQIFIPLLSGSYCYYNSFFHFELTKKLCDHVIFDCNHLSNKEEIIIMRKYAKENKRFTVGIALIFYFYIIILTSPSVSHIFLYITDETNDTQLILPVAIDTLLLDIRLFYLIFSIQLFILWVITTVAIVNYATFLLCVTHACALLSIIIFKIDQPLKKNSHKLSYDWSSTATYDTYNWIKDIVNHHVNVTEFIDLLNLLCEQIYLIQMMLGTLCFTTDYIYISDLIKNINEAILCIIYIGGSVITIYLNCYIGQRLLDHSASLLENLYQVSFYEFPIKYQKDLSMLLMRSLKPCMLSFKGMYIVSNDFFARHIHNALSYTMAVYSTWKNKS
ncbi:odorant receptor 46a-like isoform X1 [Vespula maculifrons]|uniref:Odorant receptor n=1 Tax=Vespula maculifrons TaxID=7453 RepID=A0ABD2CZC2_VESMC